MFSPEVCNKLAVSQLRALGIHSPGMVADVACACMGKPNVGTVLYFAPALRYGREWWLATPPSQAPEWDVLSHPDLVSAFDHEVVYLHGRCNIERNDIVARPVLAALVAFASVGWVPIAANRFKDRQGFEVSLLDLSEAALKARLLADAAAGAAAAKFQRYRDKQPSLTDGLDHAWLKPAVSAVKPKQIGDGEGVGLALSGVPLFGTG